MRIISTIYILFSVSLFCLLLGCSSTPEYEVVRFTKAPDKLFYGHGVADSYFGDDWAITNIITDPFTLIVAHPKGECTVYLRNKKYTTFGAHPKWTATIRNNTTREESVVTISDRPEKLIHLGTNTYFVVDIRIAKREVLLKNIKTGSLRKIYGVKTNSF